MKGTYVCTKISQAFSCAAKFFLQLKSRVVCRVAKTFLATGVTCFFPISLITDVKEWIAFTFSESALISFTNLLTINNK